MVVDWSVQVLTFVDLMFMALGNRRCRGCSGGKTELEIDRLTSFRGLVKPYVHGDSYTCKQRYLRKTLWSLVTVVVDTFCFVQDDEISWYVVYVRPHRLQIFQSMLWRPPLRFREPTLHQYSGNPATINAITTTVCNGSAKTARLSKKRLTQQKITGVVIQHL